jgi:glycosyltransferase involved in cell wall biosynthesis
MPVYNGEVYLREAIESVLNQTFEDLEFLIINDGSTDGSRQIIQSYSDSRIRLINLDYNHGLPYVRNLGLAESRGEFLAWFDCDDISVPERLADEVTFLDARPEVGACGSYVYRFSRKKGDIKQVHTEHDRIRAALLFRSEILNPSAMIRTSVIKQQGLQYDHSMFYAEDYDFWQRLCSKTKLSNVPKVLVKYRMRQDGAHSTSSKRPQAEQLHKQIYKKGLSDLGMYPSEEELSRHRMIASKVRLHSIDQVEGCLAWLEKVRLGCLHSGIISESAVNEEMFLQAFRLFKKAESLGLRSFFRYYRNPFISYGSLPLIDHVKYFLKSIAALK